jgi:hypothetical protein
VPTPAAAPAPEPAPAPAPTKVAAAEPTPAASGKDTEDDKAAPSEEPSEADEPHAKTHKSPILVTFKSDPEGAKVATKNHVYGTTPQPAKLAPGTTYELTFTKTGYAPATKKYVVPSAGKGPQTLHVSLKKLPEPKKAPAKAAPAQSPSPPQPKKGWFSR